MVGGRSRIVVTGSSGHLGEAIVRTTRGDGDSVVGVDIVTGPATQVTCSITDRPTLLQVMQGADVVFHTAALHKPHITTHSKAEFVDVNIRGTLAVLESAHQASVGAVVLTSTTSAFGSALRPPWGGPAAWISETVAGEPSNIYGASKTAAEEIARLVHRESGLPIIIVRTSRFFPEADDDPARRSVGDTQVKAIEYLHRRLALEDAVSVHRAAARAAPDLGFAQVIASATTPLQPDDVIDVRRDLRGVLSRRLPESLPLIDRLGWDLDVDVDRIYDNRAARELLGWTPDWDFMRVLHQVAATGSAETPLATQIGRKGYHAPRPSQHIQAG